MREILKASLTTGSGSFISLILGAVALKLLAITLGPSGVGLFSLLRQTQQTASVIGSCGGQTALVQALASRKLGERAGYLADVVAFFILGTLIIAAIMMASAPWLGPLIFGLQMSKSDALVRWIAFPTIVGVVLAFLTGVLNGYRAIACLAWSQMAAAITIAVLAYPAAILVKGGQLAAFAWLLALALSASVAVLLTTAIKQGWLPKISADIRLNFRTESSRHFFSMAGTSMITGLITTGTVLAVRAIVTRSQGLKGAGIFDVSWTFSMMYVMLILTSFSTYYLPTLSEIREPAARGQLMQRVMRLAILIMVPLVISAIVLKPIVVHLLYSKEFIPALETMRWMLIGDYFKVISWVLSISMLAFADMKSFFLSELAGNIFLVFGSALAVFRFGAIQGIGFVFLLMYICYFAYTLVYVFIKHDFLLTSTTVASLVTGLVLIVVASWSNWNSHEARWQTAVCWILLAIGFSVWTMDRTERHEFLLLFSMRKG